ncbi:MAG: hypothetical protein GXO77_12815 [Calditrichaeota bacterium]|nr:hypothetical protein [Calditrichota bacterium]
MKKIVLLAAALSLVVLGCAKKSADRVVAEIGNDKITLTEFRLAYMELLKDPKVYDSKKLREKFLNELVNRKLFAAVARKKGLQNNEKLRNLVNAYREKCLRDAHYAEVIKPEIRIDEAEVKAVYAYTRQQRKIKHLFFKTKEEADSAYNLLRSGANWDDLALKTFDDPQLAANGGDLGWVHWDQLEYDLAMTAFGQKKGTFSEPVKSTYGYHIIFTDDLKLDPFVTEDEFKMRRDKIYKLVEAKKGEKIARDYIEQKMRNVSVKVAPRVMKVVGNKLGKLLRRNPSQFDQMKTFQLQDRELHSLELSLWDLRKEVLAYINGKPLTVEKFIYALNFVPYRAVRKSFKTALDYVIRDQVITAEAREMGLDKKYKFVSLKPEIYEDYLLQLTLRRQLVKKVKISSREIERYFESNRQKFNNLPLDSLKRYLKKELLNDKRIRTIAFKLDSLRKAQGVKLYPEPINEYYENILSKAR